MAKIIMFILLLTLQTCFSTVSGQTLQKVLNSGAEVVIKGTYFQEGFDSKKWSNVNGAYFTGASYKKYSGITYQVMQVLTPGTLTFHYKVEVAEGTLKMQVINENNSVLAERTLSQDENTTFSLELPATGTYRIMWVGAQTRGGYFMEWNIAGL